MTDLARLKELAEKATPGPWKRGDGKRSYFVLAAAVRNSGLADVCTVSINNTENDAAYIAAASPDKVLAILAEIERMRKALQDAKHEIEELSGDGLTQNARPPILKQIDKVLGGK